MSDGDSATPGRPGHLGPSDPGADNQWLTRTPRSSPGAAPWERSIGSESEDAVAAESTGNHTDGVTVADLIAKVQGDASVPNELKKTRPASSLNPNVRPPPSPPRSSRPSSRPTAIRTPKSSPSARRRPLGAAGSRHGAATRSGAAVAREFRTLPRTTTAPRAPQDDDGRTRDRGPDRCAGAGPHRRCMAMAVVEKQHAQPDFGTGPGFARHSGPQRRSSVTRTS